MTTSSASGNLASGKAWSTRNATRVCQNACGAEEDGLTGDDEGLHENQAQNGKSGIVWTIADNELATGGHEPENGGQGDGAPASKTDCVCDAGGETELDKENWVESSRFCDPERLNDGKSDAQRDGDDRRCEEIADHTNVDWLPAHM